jgi:hypothetical protein
MKIHSTNYFNTFIEVSEDTKAERGSQPPSKINKTVAAMQYEYIAHNPYQFSSDEVLFQIFAIRNKITKAAFEEAKVSFFSKGQPCFRTSALTKSYGFGIHYNDKGKMALYGMETKSYQQFLADIEIKKIKAMKSSKL